MSTRIIAVANMKGGVAKTTTSINLAACLAEMGKTALVVDLDPQANATSGLGIDPRALEGSIYEILLEDLSFEDCVEGTSVKGLFILPSTPDLGGAEVELATAYGREHRLSRALEPHIDDYDYIFIDCPPSLGLLTVNALTIATEILIPIQCEYFALEGLGQLLENMDLIRQHINPNLELGHILLVMFNSSTNLSKQVEDEVREKFGDKVCKQMIPRSVSLAEAPKTGQPITKYKPSSRGAVAYKAAAKEILAAELNGEATAQDEQDETEETITPEKENKTEIAGVDLDDSIDSINEENRDAANNTTEAIDVEPTENNSMIEAKTSSEDSTNEIKESEEEPAKNSGRFKRWRINREEG